MIIPIATCSGLCDRISYQASQFISTLNAIGVAGGGQCFTRVSAPNIYAVERDFDTPAYNWDQAASGITIFPQISQLATLINAFDTHTQNEGQVTFDQYLTNSGLQVSDTFANVYLDIRNTSLSATNVFSETDVLMGQVTYLGGGSWAFTAGTPLGTGSGAFSSTNHCAQQLLAYIGSGVTISSSTTVTVTALRTDGITTDNLNVNFSSSDPANTHKAIGNATQQYIRVTNITATGSPSGTPTIFVRQIRERVPGL